MDEGLFLALAERVIEQVDDRYGRAAAWLCAVVMLAVPPALLVVAIGWFSA